MGTSALVPAWTPFSDKEKIIYKGLAEKVFTATKAGMPHVKPDAMDWVPIDAERLKRVYDDLVTDAGAKVLFNTFFSACETDGHGKVTAVILSNKSGMTAKSAKVYVDCTGDADLCAWAGAEFHKGDEQGKGLMPATHCFILANVDDYGSAAVGSMHGSNPKSPIHAIIKSGKYPRHPRHPPLPQPRRPEHDRLQRRACVRRGCDRSAQREQRPDDRPQTRGSLSRRLGRVRPRGVWQLVPRADRFPARRARKPAAWWAITSSPSRTTSSVKASPMRSAATATSSTYTRR